MRLLLLGKRASITHWLEDAAAALRSAGHEVRIGAVRRPWLAAGLEGALAEPLAAALAAKAAAFAPDLILAIGGFHAPPVFLERLEALKHRAPLVGWVGDLFGPEAGETARLYDLIAYTDSGLAARHRALGFSGPALFLPHAANPAASPVATPARSAKMVFVGNATAGRRAVVEAIDAPIALWGPGWEPAATPRHEVHPGRIAHARVGGLYAGHLAALNIRNERNVLGGLNQRSFDPCLAATAVLGDDQPDLALCFEPGVEALVWREPEELNAHYARLRADPVMARRIGEAGRRRVLADHTYPRRLEALLRAL